MPSILQRAKGLFGGSEQKPTEPTDLQTRIFNPLHARVGEVLKVNSVDYVGKEFAIRELLEYDFGREECVSVYVAKEREGDLVVRVRLQHDEGRLRAVVCQMHDELDEEPGIVGAVSDRGGVFVITRHDKGDEQEKYHRLGDLRAARPVHISRLTDRNGNGEIEVGEVERWNADTWDYSRKTQADGVDVREYLYVERAPLLANGKVVKRVFRIWRGLAVSPEQISLG